jgi:SAM-dependent methyltransferase
MALINSPNDSQRFSPRRFFQSLVSLFEDRFFDLRHGTRTSSVVEVAKLDISDSDKRHAVRYKPTRARYFRKLLEQYELPTSSIFVDVGCGLGRVVLLAAMQGYRMSIGLEISPTLAAGAEENLESFRRRNPKLGRTQIVCTNVLHHDWNHDETVFFLFWPFDREVTQQFIGILKQSLAVSPREVTLIINEFQFRDLLESDDTFSHVKRIVYGAAEFDIYTSAIPV